jgi:hypothetical protein
VTGGDVVVGADGRRLTVRELVRQRPDSKFEASRSGSYSVIQGIYPATLAEVAGDACCQLPPFKGEMEVRVQTRVLRLEGRWRDGLAWKQERVKLPLEQVAHLRLRGSLVDLGLLATATEPLQRVTLDLASADMASEFAALLTQAAPWPAEPQPAPARVRVPLRRAHWRNPQVWGLLVGTAIVVAVVLMVVWSLTHR